jgi:hypothetical protein
MVGTSRLAALGAAGTMASKDYCLFELAGNFLGTDLRACFSLHPTARLRQRSFLTLYRKNRPNATPTDICFAITTDRMMRMDAITQAERKAAQHGAPVYLYIFEWQTPVLRSSEVPTGFCALWPPS